MAETAIKKEKKTTSPTKGKKKAKSRAELQISDRKVFLYALGVLLLAAIFTFMSPLRAVFHSQYGMFANAAILFYVVAFGYGLKGIYDLNMENWKRWRGLGIICMIALFMAAEELHWGLAFILEEDNGWVAESLRDLIARALLGVPEGASFGLIVLIASVRMAVLLSLVYLAVGMIFFRERIAEAYGKTSAHPAWFYGCIFAGLLLSSILLKADWIPGDAAFSGPLRLAMALAFLMGSLQFQGKG